MLLYKLAVKGQTPSGATHKNNMRKADKALHGSGVLLPCSEIYACIGGRSSVKNNVTHSLPTLTFLTRLNIPACDSARLLGWASWIVLRYNSEML